MPFVYFGHILHVAVTNLHCVSAESSMWFTRLWKMSIDQLKKKPSELVGLNIRSKLEKILPKSNFALDRNDRLALLSHLNGQQTDKVGKKYHWSIEKYWF